MSAPNKRVTGWNQNLLSVFLNIIKESSKMPKTIKLNASVGILISPTSTILKDNERGAQIINNSRAIPFSMKWT